MSRTLAITAVQAEPLDMARPIADFHADVRRQLQNHPGTRLLIYPELHLFGDGSPDAGRTEALEAAAEPLDGPRIQALRDIAKTENVWLVPGSVCERGPRGELFNTQVVLSPAGELTASYRKIFPWRPSEPYVPGAEFATADIDGAAEAGLHICYDSWFPETTRQLAWMGAEVILNVVKTTTPDRAQELVLARAHAITNQVFFVSINVAGTTGEGKSIVVGPEGEVLAEATGSEPETLAVQLDLDAVARVRQHGTAGTNRMWCQFHEGEPPIQLPVYDGRIDPASWNPDAKGPGIAPRTSTGPTEPQGDAR